MKQHLAKLYRAENFWQTMLVAGFAVAVYASGGSRFAAGFISAIAMFFAFDCVAEVYPKYFKRMGIQG